MGAALDNPPARRINANGTVLTVGAVPDGQALKRSGATIVGGFAGAEAGALDDFTPTLTPGQTIFTLSQAPSDPNRVVVDVNGGTYRSVLGHFTVVGTTLTWIPGVAGFSIEVTDTFVAAYPVSA